MFPHTDSGCLQTPNAWAASAHPTPPKTGFGFQATFGQYKTPSPVGWAFMPTRFTPAQMPTPPIIKFPQNGCPTHADSGCLQTPNAWATSAHPTLPKTGFSFQAALGQHATLSPVGWAFMPTRNTPARPPAPFHHKISVKWMFPNVVSGCLFGGMHNIP